MGGANVEINCGGRGVVEGEGGQEGSVIQDRPNKGFDAYCTTYDGQNRDKGAGRRMGRLKKRI